MIMEHRRTVTALALLASFMVFVDGTIVTLTVAQLSSHLGATRSQLEWTVNAYTLSFAAVMLGAGAIADTFGAKRTFLAGLMIFTASSGLCAAADSMTVLNGARLVQGIGAALLLPSALILATAGGRGPHERQRLVGWWAAAGGLGMAAGPLLGGTLVAVANWRAVFAVNLAVGIPAIVWSIRVMPAVARRHRRIDVAGMTAAAVMIGGLVFALIEAPARGWLSADVLVAMAAAGAGLICYCLVELSASSPLLPTALYRNATFATTAVQGGLFNFTFYGLLFALGLMLQQGRGLGALTAGLVFLSLTGLIPVGAVAATPLARRAGPVAVLAAGQGVLMISLAAAGWAGAAHALWPLVLSLVPAGLSAGMLVPTMTSRSLADVERGQHGAAASSFNTSRQVGSAVGIATFGPLLGGTRDITGGFTACMVIAAVATLAALVLTVMRRRPPLRLGPGDRCEQSVRDAERPTHRISS